MENRLKERLTGAAILVALIVALVPEMFRGQRGEGASSTSSSGDGPPVRSYTIDLSNNPKSSVPLQSMNDEPRKGESPAATPPPPTSSAPKPEASQAQTSKAETSANASPTHTVRATTPPASPGASRGAPAGGWSVQLGLFAKRDNAERMAHEAQTRGFNVTISNPDANALFHVHAVGLQDRAAAQALSQRMQAEGIKSAVVPP